MIKAKPELLCKAHRQHSQLPQRQQSPHSHNCCNVSLPRVYSWSKATHLDRWNGTAKFKMLEEIKFQLARGLKHFQAEQTFFYKHRSRECGSTRGGDAPSDDGQGSCRVFWMHTFLQPGTKIISHDFPGLFNSQKDLKINIAKQVPLVVTHILQWKPLFLLSTD